MSPQESLLLKPLGLTMWIDKLFVWRNDERIYRWCRQFEPISHRKHWDWVRWQAKDPHTRMYAVWSDGVLCGVCGLTSIDWINRRAEVSLYIDPDKHRQGLGTKAGAALLRHAFEVLNLNSVWGESFEGSPAISRFKALGFSEDGRRRQFYYREGKYVDAILWSLTRDEHHRHVSATPDPKGGKPKSDELHRIVTKGRKHAEATGSIRKAARKESA